MPNVDSKTHVKTQEFERITAKAYSSYDNHEYGTTSMLRHADPPINDPIEPIREAMLTTSDNPFNPFTQFDEWLTFDQSMNYFTSEYLARIAKTSDDLSDSINTLAVNQAIDEIVQLNVLGKYRKVYADDSFGSTQDSTV